MQTTTTVRRLLPQFRKDNILFLPEHLNQEVLRVQRDNTSRTDVLRPEMSQVECDINGAPQWTAAASTCRSFSSFVMRGIKDS